MFWNNQFSKKIITSLKQLSSSDSLTPNELLQIRQQVLLRLAEEPEKFNWQAWFKQRRLKFLHTALAVLAGVSVIGGTAYAAGGAVPGDVLYPVKRINEQARLSVAPSEQAKVALKVKFAEERIKELEKLKAKHQAKASIIKDEDKKMELQATTDTQLEVDNAIEVLTSVKAKQEKDGNVQAAAAISKNIKRLQKKAERQELKLKAKMEDNDKQENDRERLDDNSSSTPSSIGENENKFEFRNNKDNHRDRSGDNQEKTQ